MSKSVSVTIRPDINLKTTVVVSVEDEQVDGSVTLGELAAELYNAVHQKLAMTPVDLAPNITTYVPTTYASHDDAHYNSKTAAGCEASGEPCFTLRAQDIHAADAVRAWASQVTWHNRVMAEKAMEIADAMDAWPVKKEPDL